MEFDQQHAWCRLPPAVNAGASAQAWAALASESSQVNGDWPSCRRTPLVSETMACWIGGADLGDGRGSARRQYRATGRQRRRDDGRGATVQQSGVLHCDSLGARKTAVTRRPAGEFRRGARLPRKRATPPTHAVPDSHRRQSGLVGGRMAAWPHSVRPAYDGGPVQRPGSPRHGARDRGFTCRRGEGSPP